VNLSNNLFDILIIGAGPAGIATAIEAKQAGLNYLLIDKGSVAHSIQQFQRDMFFFSTPELLSLGDVPFIVSTTRPTSLDCVNYYRGIVEYFKLKSEFHQEIESVTKDNTIFNVQSTKGKVFQAKAVVIATGYYDTPTPLGVPGENLPHVTHFYRDSLPYYRQNIVIVGGKNSAVEAALDLYRHGANVTLIHRDETLTAGVKYWILPDFENRVKEGSIKVHYNTAVSEFQVGKTLVKSNDGTLTEIPTDSVFILIGYLPDVQFLKSVGIQIEEDSLVPTHNPETFETNVPNLFIAGGLVGGRFNNRVFIENGRQHGKKIIDTLLQK